MSPLSSSQGSKEGKELRTKSRAGSESFESSSQQSTASHKRKISQTLDACSTPRSNKTEKSQPTTDSEVNNQEAGTSSDDVNTGRVTRVTRSKSKLKQNPNSHSVHSPASSTSSNRQNFGRNMFFQGYCFKTCPSKAAFFRFLIRPFYSEFFQLVEFLKTKQIGELEELKKNFL